MSDPPPGGRPDVLLLIPVYNDWASLQTLLRALGNASFTHGMELSVVVVDDGSSQPVASDLLDGVPAGSIRAIEIVHLHLNLGHQSAIAVGLSEIYHRHPADLVIVMDADGEDRPEDIERFLEAHSQHRISFVVAQRARRTESHWFRILYTLYRLVFRIFVGKGLDYGNFCLIPRPLLGRIVFNPMSWNHLAAAISRSGIDIVRVKADRGTRFHGTSSMSLPRLISHGLSAVSVFLDVAMIRVLIFSSLIMSFALLGVLTTLYFRLFTDLAIPGWATSAVGLLSIIGLQGLVLSTIASFLALRSRSGVSRIPAIDAATFIAEVERIRGNG